ncbi:Protein-S-isoprenylcysteine O-methyltransferase [Pleurotus pulmonarius]
MNPNALLDTRNWLVLVNGISFYLTLTPPNRPVPKSRQIIQSMYEKTILVHILAMKTFICSVCLLHILSSFTEGVLDLCAAGPSYNPSTTPSKIMITATCMGFAMNAIRLWCFATLGDHFDFQVNIKKTHRLITSGPYSFVRHPSYTSGYGVFIAVTLVMFSEDHWFSRCARRSAVGRMVGWLWFVELAMLGYNFLVVRTNVEDEGLKKHFGKEWDEWAARVPYRIFPYIY